MALRVDLHFPDLSAAPDLFEVHRLELTDALSQLFELHVVAFSAESDINPRGLLGQRVEVRLRDEPLLPTVTGIVRKAARHTAEQTGTTEYRLTVAPREWLLTRARQTCIYQQKAGPDIADEVLKRHGPQMRSPDDFPAAHVREYCVQYGETDHDFVFRVLAEDGLTTLFDHKNGGAWVWTDDTSRGSIQLSDRIVFNPSNLTPEGPAVLRWEEIASVETARVSRRDYDYTKPGFTLQASQAAQSPVSVEASLEDYTYATGAFIGDGDGKELVTLRLHAARALANKLRLITNFAAGAGSRIHIQGPDIEGDWVVVRCHTVLGASQGEREQLHHELIVIAASVPYRPQPWPKPRVMGVQVAYVVGDTPAGTVDTDDLGRVKVELRWDRRDLGKGNPTRRVRVAQAWAGPGFGLVTIPRVGDEVLIAYSEGDPDLPLVVGRVHNTVNATPLKLPDKDNHLAVWRSRSFNAGGLTDGYNQILMDDTDGAERLEIHAQLDSRHDTGRSSATTVGLDETKTVGNNSSTKVGSAYSLQSGSTSISTGPYTLSATTIEEHARTDMTLTAGDVRRDKSANHFIESGSLYISLKDVMQVNAPNLHTFNGSSIRLNSKSSFVNILPGGVDVHGDGPVNITGTEIKLTAGGSTIHITSGGIKITSSGAVQINGSFITLN